MSKTTIFKNLFLSASALAGLSLVACASPGPMPHGYTYHDNGVFQSKTPPKSTRITDAMQANMGAAQAEQFRVATYDLVTRLTARAGLPPQQAYVMSAEPMSAFYTNIDNDLREAMRATGYSLADNAQGAYVFAYDAVLLPGARDVAAADMTANVQLTLFIFNMVNGTLNQLTQETGQYYIQGAEDFSILSTMNNLEDLQDRLNPESARLRGGADWQASRGYRADEMAGQYDYNVAPVQVMSEPVEMIPQTPEMLVDMPDVMSDISPELPEPSGFEYSSSMNDNADMSAPSMGRARISRETN